MCKVHDVTVFAHPVFRDHVEAELAARPRENLRFVWVELEGPWDPWDNDKGERGLRLHYNLWQRKLLKVLRRTMETERFDLVHHVSWGSLHQPPRVWKCGLPFVWGPLGGGQTWPTAFLDYAEKRRNFEKFRGMVVKFACWNPSVLSAVRKADLIFATNRETLTLLNRLGARRVELFGDCGVQTNWLRDITCSTTVNRLVLLSAGRLEARKGLPLALQAVAAVRGIDVKLLIAGEGPERHAWAQMAEKLGIADRVEFLGQVPWVRMPELFTRADALIFPSLRDSAGTVVLEAMGSGLPIITLDHQGVSCLVTSDAGIKVPVTEPAQVVQGLADAITSLARDPELRQRMSRAAERCAEEQTWERRARKMATWYEEVLRAHRSV